ncbi:hypothetical protein BJ875DRAFT_524420 [Amylocarpus encephaloides]|uniref:Uncharacterized protein n=1 Tax=Amylocarpus encephaloides TaxID=45428 RepID=A0A9P7Y8F1_9HELO|nr:hypothetical protein BJ875DRAFT_524420 [Amylocarpus encephaloides]
MVMDHHGYYSFNEHTLPHSSAMENFNSPAVSGHDAEMASINSTLAMQQPLTDYNLPDTSDTFVDPRLIMFSSNHNFEGNNLQQGPYDFPRTAGYEFSTYENSTLNQGVGLDFNSIGSVPTGNIELDTYENNSQFASDLDDTSKIIPISSQQNLHGNRFLPTMDEIHSLSLASNFDTNFPLESQQFSDNQSSGLQLSSTNQGRPGCHTNPATIEP